VRQNQESEELTNLIQKHFGFLTDEIVDVLFEMEARDTDAGGVLTCSQSEEFALKFDDILSQSFHLFSSDLKGRAYSQ